MPLYFEPNVGQGPALAQFLARGHDYQFMIWPTEAQLVLRKVQVSPSPSSLKPADFFDSKPNAQNSKLSFRSLRLSFPRANQQARVHGEAAMPGIVNYLIGNDPAGWHTRVPTYARVAVQDLYPGIDLTYHGQRQQFEYDFIVAPGADPAAIALQFDGADQLTVNTSGELVLSLGANEMRQPRPVLYQMQGGVRQPVQGGYRLADARTAQFAIGPYDHTRALVIDPVLSYSTYLGGNSGDVALGIKLDPKGFVYLAGQTLSTSFPFPIPPGSFQSSFQGGSQNGDGFVAKLCNTGTNLVYFTYLGGSGEDAVNNLAVDSAGNAYVTGFTDSTNFPTANALYPNISGVQDPKTHVYPLDAFVAELNATGSGLVYSTYLGGSDVDNAVTIAVDPIGNAYVTGYTLSTNFPQTNAVSFIPRGSTNTLVLDHLIGNRDAFVAKISPGGSNLVYSTYLGGAALDEGQGIAADSNGVAYVTGYTFSSDFPISTNALQPYINNSTNQTVNEDAFVTKIAPGGSNLVYSSFLGGAGNDAGFHIALDGLGNAYVTGPSQSPDLNTVTNNPTLSLGYTGTNVLNQDAFLAKMNFMSNSATLVYAAVFGGTNDDVGWDVAADPAGNAYVIGITVSTNFPTTNTSGFLQPTNSGALGSADVFITAFNTNASALLYSAYLGGSANDFGYGIAVDPAGNAYIVGRTFSTNFPVVSAFTNAAPLQTALTGGQDAFVAKILMNPTLAAASVSNFVQVQWREFSPEFSLQFNTNANAPATWTPVAQPPVLTNGWHTVTVPATNPQTFFRLKR